MTDRDLVRVLEVEVPSRPGSERKPVAGTAAAPGTAAPVWENGSQARDRRPGETAVPPSRARSTRPVARTQEGTKAPPILVRQTRGGVVESRHRGSIVEVAGDGTVRRFVGDPDTVVNLRSAVKPFGLVALVEAGGIEVFGLSEAEIAIMAGSHSGEDLHVRTLQAVFRRSGISQQLLGCGSEGAPLDVLTAARLSRDGEKPGPMRHMCSGQHASLLLLCKLNDWPLTEYWRADHPVQRVYAATVARAFSTTAGALLTSTDACGLPTYAFPLREVARAFSLLADPGAIPESDSRSSLADALTRIRDAMLANPEMVAGSRDRIDSSLMKAAPGRVLSKGGAEGLRGFAILPRGAGQTVASGLALKIEDGGGYDRASSAASVEALRQAGALEGAALRSLARYHRPKGLDPHGEAVSEAIAEFDLAPVGELLG